MWIRPEHLPQEIREEAREAVRRPSPEAAVEAEKIRAVLAGGGNRDAAARALGISRTTLWRRMRKHGLFAVAPASSRKRRPPVKTA